MVNSQKNFCPVPSIRSTSPSNLPITHNTHLYAVGSGFSSGYSVLITQTVRNPYYSGDQPNNGYQYLELNATVFNNSNKTGPVPGIFLFKDSKGNLYTTADMTGALPDSMKLYANKNVSIPGKMPLSFVMLNPNQQQKTYLLYQVKTGESGEIIWKMNPFDNTLRYSTRIFSLN